MKKSSIFPRGAGIAVKVSGPDGREAYIWRGDITLDHSILNQGQMCAFLGGNKQES
jgi:hypothetical protein